MSNEEVSITEISDEELHSLLTKADIVQRFGENLLHYSFDDDKITLEFDSIYCDSILFNFNDDYKITQNGNKITIEDLSGQQETCEFRMFKKVPFSG